MTDPRHLYIVAERTAEFPCVTVAEVTDSDAYGCPIVSVVIGPDEETVPARILRRLTDHGLGVADVSPQGTHLIVRAY